MEGQVTPDPSCRDPSPDRGADKELHEDLCVDIAFQRCKRISDPELEFRTHDECDKGQADPPARSARLRRQGGPQGREPVAFVAFDQAIDAAAVLPTISARVGGKTIATRLATASGCSA